MAFEPTMYFLILHDSGTSNYIATGTQLPANIVETGTTAWNVLGATLLNGAGGGLGMNAGDLMDAFTLNSPAHPLNPSTLVFNRDIWATFGAGSTSYDRILEAFLSGGTLTLLVAEAGPPGPTAPLVVRLGYLQTTNFLMDGQTLEAAHHAGGAGNNLTVPAPTVATDYTIDFVAGGDSLSVPVSSLGTLALDGADKAPVNESSSGMAMTITRDSDSVVSTFTADVHVPTELILLLDRSGSMGAIVGGTTSKWDVAVQVAELFDFLYGSLIPDRTVSAGALSDQYEISIGTFSSSGIAFTAFVNAGSAAGIAGAPGGGTPIGQALKEAHLQFNLSAGVKWRRREVLLLTDGMDNSGTPSLNQLALGEANEGDFPSLTFNDSGAILHNISYIISGDGEHLQLGSIVGAHDGVYDDTGNAGTLAPDEYRGAFLALLSNMIPAEMGTITSDEVVVPEAGAEKLIIVSSIDPGAALTLSPVPPGMTVGTAGGFRWASIPNPIKDQVYSVTNLPGGATLGAYYDLSTRSRFTAEVTGAGKEIRLRAELKHNGVGISNVDVVAVVSRPAESQGDLLSKYAKRGGLRKAYRRRTIKPIALQAAAVVSARGSSPALKSKIISNLSAKKPSIATGILATHAAMNLAAAAPAPALAPKAIDLKAVRAQLLKGVSASRNMPFQHLRSSYQLEKTCDPGIYEVIVPAEDVEFDGVYTIEFRADGMAADAPFFRNHRFSKILKPLPDLNESTSSLDDATIVGSPGSTIATVHPKDAKGASLGPGLGSWISFQYTDPKRREELPALVTIDNFDGSYSTLIEGHPPKSAPEVGLYFHDPDIKSPPIVAKAQCKGLRRITVTLKAITILDDKDGLFKGDGEIRFKATVTPNASASRSVTTLWPSAKDHYKVGDGGRIKPESGLLFDAYVEKDAELTVAITGEELDWPACIDNNDKFARYVRTVPVTSEKYGPGDEKNDPEALADWQVQYEVKVHD